MGLAGTDSTASIKEDGAQLQDGQHLSRHDLFMNDLIYKIKNTKNKFVYKRRTTKSKHRQSNKFTGKAKNGSKLQKKVGKEKGKGGGIKI